MFSVDQGINQKKRKLLQECSMHIDAVFHLFQLITRSTEKTTNSFLNSLHWKGPIFRELRDWKYNLLYTILTVD